MNLTLKKIICVWLHLSLLCCPCLTIGELAALAADNAQGESVNIPKVDDHYRPLETLAKGLFYLETLYVDPKKVEQQTMAQNALKGVVSTLDPHTVLMPKQAFEELTIDTQGKFGGIGVIVSQDKGQMVVVSPIEDTPASRAGIISGDIITAIDGKDISKMKYSETLELMRGPAGSRIKLTIQRKGQKKPLEFTLVREIIRVRSVNVMELSKGKGIIYAKISSFQEETAQQLAAGLKKYKGKLKGIILDLRDNPGGLLDQAVQICDLFLDSGVIVSTVGRDPKRIEREFAHKRGTLEKVPMVVLVNGGSASASEIVAGALQDHKRALIIGETTFGKGSVQTLISLPDGSGLKLTVARYYTPNDRSIQAKGIHPDIVVPRALTSSDKQRPKESDLKNHIESSNLSNISEHHGLLEEVKTWPQYMQSDNQLISAYTYVKGFSLFKRP